jgi:hypothetical protein
MQNDGDFLNVIMLLTLCIEAVSWSGCLAGVLVNLNSFGGELTIACRNICIPDTHRVRTATICRIEQFLPLLRTEASVGRPALGLVKIGNPDRDHSGSVAKF